MAIRMDRALSPTEIRRISDNHYQIFSIIPQVCVRCKNGATPLMATLEGIRGYYNKSEELLKGEI